MRSPVLSLFSTNKNTKFVKTMIYIYRVVYTTQTKARKALDRSIKFVKTTIYLNRVVYKTKKYRQRRHQQKIKNLHSKRSIVFYYRSWSTKVNYIKHCLQEKKYQC